jgi:hypothetical protein
MDKSSQLTFLARHFNDMRGLRLAPVFVLPMLPWTRPRVWVVVLTVVFCALWFWLWQRHYKQRYGHIVSAYRPSGSRIATILLILPAIAVFVYYAIIRGQLLMPGFWGLYLAAYTGREAIDSVNLQYRRLYYAAGTLFLAGSSVLTLLIHGSDVYHRFFLPSICITLLALSLLDHWLLVRTFAQVSRAENA